jgi:ATP-dependent helicase/nuclease subunit A
VLRNPTLSHLFAPSTLAEVELAAQIGDQTLVGTIDRLVIGAESVLAVDYKSNAVIPDDPGNVPEGLLRQMGAYEAALRRIYPNHRIETAILWTTTATLMPLPHDMVRAAWERATTS